MIPVEFAKMFHFSKEKLDEVYNNLKVKEGSAIQYRFLGCCVCRDWTKHKVITDKDFRLSICEVCKKEFKEVKIYGEWVCLIDLIQMLEK